MANIENRKILLLELKQNTYTSRIFVCIFFGRKMTSLVEYNNWYYMLKLFFENYEINFVYFLTLISWYNLMI